MTDSARRTGRDGQGLPGHYYLLSAIRQPAGFESPPPTIITSKTLRLMNEIFDTFPLLIDDLEEALETLKERITENE